MKEGGGVEARSKVAAETAIFFSITRTTDHTPLNRL